MDHTTSWVAQHFRDRMTQKEIDEALVLAMEADKREIERLRDENDRLRQALADEAVHQTLIKDLTIGPNGIKGQFEGGAAQLLAESFAQQFSESGATNYIEFHFTGADTGPLLVTLQRRDGKTPHQLRAEAEGHVGRLRAELADSTNDLDELLQVAADLATELAASQAREKALREKIVLAQIGSCSCGAKTPDTRYHSAFCVYSQLAGILALPADDTALREMLARAQEEMRERCIEEVRGVGGIDAIEVERLIRALEVKP